ncbi:jg20058 [Pararge aegeria aegeria]|uniref:Jg20058 protein n=1 Tax=Pararge aegeria aegeria TaxID=348720 RepID=A0A8S4RDW4_9NEOP|nr:jg20058 [Pararge aegeria aegeria]
MQRITAWHVIVLGGKFEGDGRPEMSRFSGKPGEDGRSEDAAVRGSPHFPVPRVAPRPSLTSTGDLLVYATHIGGEFIDKHGKAPPASSLTIRSNCRQTFVSKKKPCGE